MKFYLIAAALLIVLALVMTIVPGFQFSITLCFAFAALLVLMYYLKRFPTPLATTVFKIICVLLILGAAAAAVTASFIIRAAHPGQLPKQEYVVVLGAGVHGAVPSLTLQERVNAAYDYLIANPDATAILTGGQGPGEDITEAACMARELTRMGIDPSRLLLEEAATSTIENLRFSMDLLQAETGSAPKSIAIVSSEYHLFRACLFAKSLGIDAVGIPAKTAIFPLRCNYYLREIVAVWKYFVLGP